MGWVTAATLFLSGKCIQILSCIIFANCFNITFSFYLIALHAAVSFRQFLLHCMQQMQHILLTQLFVAYEIDLARKAF